MATIAAASPNTLWFLARGSGLVTLILLTLSVALGVANVQRLQTARVPRFVINAVHRNASLLALVFLAIHIVTIVLDSYVNISLIDAVVPFGAGYRPLWVGLGAVALDLLLAVVVTSLLRRHIGHRAWRATHWLAYACWPVALLHGLGTGTDAGTTWMLAVTGVCVAVVVAAVLARLSERHDDRRGGTRDRGRVGGRARDQHRTPVVPGANLAGKPPVTDRQALAGHAAVVVPVGERV
jgi:methionine sulfoxide reductase heme-binding subunit